MRRIPCRSGGLLNGTAAIRSKRLSMWVSTVRSRV
jgi:hypothetical protein